MLLIAAAALATASTPPASSSATVQARATIRIVTAVKLKLAATVNPGAPDAHDAVLKFSDGTSQPAKLIEFQ